MNRSLLLMVFLFALAVPAVAQDSVSNANVSTLIFRGRSSAPSLSTSTQAVLYFDTASGRLKVSEAGGAYANLSGGGGGTPGGANTQVQFNDSGSFGGDAGLAYNKTTNFLTITSGGITLSSSTINKITITAPATGATFTLADGKTLTVSNTLTFTGTDSSSIAFGGGGTVVYTADKLSVLASTTSAELAGVISNETGTGLAVFNDTPTILTPAISGAITFPDNIRQTFNPGADASGLNVGAIAGDPGTPSNGDIWYDSTANELTARINGASVVLGAGGTPGGSDTQLQRNNAGAFGGISGATSDGTSVTFGSGNLLATSPKITTGINDANGNSLIAVTATGSAIFGATLANAASGGTVAWGVTTPTQGASGIAGTPVSFRASDAVAGSLNAGAVAGGSVTITSGDAKRLTSGNANGGAINITAGAGIGTGVQGTVTVSAAQLIVPVGSSTAPGLGLSANTGIYLAAGQPAIASAGTAVAMFRSTASQPGIDVGASASSQIYFGTALTGLDVAIGRDAAGVAEISNGVLGQWGSLKLGVRDAGTTTVVNGLTVGHQSTGTPAAGLGSAIQYNINSSTTADQNAGQLGFLWTDATHATRTADFIVTNVLSGAAQTETFRIKANALIVQPQTITAGGTTGNQTINKPAGTVNIAAGNSSVTVTNSLVTTSSQVFAVVRTNDTTATIKNVVPGSGSFVITLTAAATAEVSIGFWMVNQ